MQEVIDHLKTEGYILDSFAPDGKIHRFQIDSNDKRKSGFYVGYQNFLPSNGERFYVVTYGSWKDGLDNAKTYSTLRSACSPEDRRLVQDQMAKQKRATEQARIREWESVAADVQRKWDSLLGGGQSEYLSRKKISDCPDLGVRFRDGNVYVPIKDDKGKIWSLQRISPDGTKRFHPGGRVMGCSHLIGELTGEVLYLAEGLATAATIRIATGGPVVCAFSASSLSQAAAQYQRDYPDRRIIVCGDDDRGNPENPGRKSAESAAAKTFGAAVFPVFRTEAEGSDWNDLQVLEGIGAVRDQLKEAPKTETLYLTALGFKEKEYFFTSSKNQQIVAVSSFSKSDFLNLMPIEYWETVFPGSGQSRVNWDNAMSHLMESARTKGIFESQNIRGAGVWRDDGRVVVNMGDHLIIDGKACALGDIKSKFFYTLGIKLPGLNPNPLSLKECEVVLEAASLFKWKKPDFAYLLAGAMVTTRICGALPIRPHVWLTGEKGSGKTTLFNRFIYPLIGEPLIFAGGNSTEAGIRQEVCANAVPVLFDEFENNGPRSAESIQSVLDLMRLSWSETRAAIIKGSSGGTSSQYRARFAAIVTSIRQVSLTDADKSRFATLELDAHDSDLVHWKQLNGFLNKINVEFGNRLFARTIRMIPTLFHNFEEIKSALSRKCPGQRFGDQYGMLLAGYSLLVDDARLCASGADFLVSHVGLDDERNDATVTDQSSALSHLLTWKLTYEGDNGRREDLVGDLIEVARFATSSAAGKALNLIGVKVHSDKVVIASGGDHAELAKIYRGTQWSGVWGASLLRLTGAKKVSPRIEGRQFRAVEVPTSFFTSSVTP